MPAISYNFADKQFKTQKAALEYFSNYLKENDTIKDDDYAAIYDLFSKHEGLAMSTIKYIDIAIDYSGKPHNAFRVTYENDGEIIREFKSYKKAILGYNRTTEINKQFREAVKSQVIHYKQTHKTPEICTCCKGWMEDLEPELDHYPLRFCDIVSWFMRIKRLSYENMPVNKQYKILNREILDEFAEFHREKARYRIICRECNAKSFHNPDLGKCIYSIGNDDEII